MPQDWNFYSVVVGIIALIFTLIGAGWALYERSKNQRDLRYQPLDSVSLLIEQPNIGELVILYNDVRVEKPHVTSIEIKNYGKLPITPNDFIEPMVILGEGKILTAVVSGAIPDNLNPSINIDDNRATIQPLLLNGADTFRVNLLTDGAYNNPEISARIAGVKEIKKISKSSPMLIGIIIGIIGIISLLTGILLGYLSGYFFDILF